jgi:hypothetical protein
MWPRQTDDEQLRKGDQTARLMGYEGTVVHGTRDRLRREKLVEQPRASQFVIFETSLRLMQDMAAAWAHSFGRNRSGKNSW